MIVALRVMSPKHEPADPRVATFCLDRQSGQCVLNFFVRPFDELTWCAPPGDEIIVVPQHGLAARCDERRPMDIAYRGLDASNKIKGVRLDEAGLRDMSQLELDLWWRAMCGGAW